MPNRRLQWLKHRPDLIEPKRAWQMKSFMRKPGARQYIRQLMLERLRREVELKEKIARINATLNIQSTATKPRVRRKKTSE